MCGLAAAMMLADDGHEVVVVERDAAPPPPSPEDAFAGWDRRSVAQFGLAHFLLARGTGIMRRELPEVYDLLTRHGGFRYNMVTSLGSRMEGFEPADDDDRFELLTGRRSTLEWAMASAAEAHPGVTVRRGEVVDGLTAGTPLVDGVPHVTGLRLSTGEDLLVDLVIDASGRRSPTLDWLDDLGARAPVEHNEDSGFAYFGRYFRSADGSVPASLGPGLIPYGSFSVLTLPADNGTWSVTLYGLSTDKPLRRFRDPEVHERVVRACPLQAHWLDGEPISDMAAMAGVVDRHRQFVVDDQPCATGILSVADASSCTNPSLGRGITLGLMHVEVLRSAIRDHIEDPWTLALAFHEATERDMRPWHDTSTALDRRRVREMRAIVAGEAIEPEPAAEIANLLAAASTSDPQCSRILGELTNCLAMADEIFARPGVFEHVVGLAGAVTVKPAPGPDREQLLELVS
jgi:2-polyprenyl-6-methoxyphenol hydroxylase-like FAD-dependent oxidoreductase